MIQYELATFCVCLTLFGIGAGDFIERQEIGDYFEGDESFQRGVSCQSNNPTQVTGEIFGDSQCINDYRIEFECGAIDLDGSTTIKFISSQDVNNTIFKLTGLRLCDTSDDVEFVYQPWGYGEWIDVGDISSSLALIDHKRKEIQFQFRRLWSGQLLKIGIKCYKKDGSKRVLLPASCAVVKHEGSTTLPIKKSMFGMGPDPPTTTTTTTTTSTTTTTTTTTESSSSTSKDPGATDVRETTNLPTTTTEFPDYIHRSASGDYCTNDECDCKNNQRTYLNNLGNRDRCVDSYSNNQLDCQIASNNQFKILTVVEDDVQKILINKTCSKQATFDVFVWDGDWKSLHSSKVESLFIVEDTNNQDQMTIRFTKHLSGIVIKITIQCPEEAVLSSDCFVVKFNGSTTEMVNFDLINKILEPSTTTTTTTSPTLDTLTSTDESEIMVIVGCAVGGLVLLLLFIVCLICIVRKKKKAKKKQHQKALSMSDVQVYENPYKRSTIGNPTYDKKLHSTRAHAHCDDPYNQNREYAEIDPSIYSLPLSQNQPIEHSKPYEFIDENKTSPQTNHPSGRPVSDPVYREIEEAEYDEIRNGKPVVPFPAPDYPPGVGFLNNNTKEPLYRILEEDDCDSTTGRNAVGRSTSIRHPPPDYSPPPPTG